MQKKKKSFSYCLAHSKNWMTINYGDGLNLQLPIAEGSGETDHDIGSDWVQMLGERGSEG